MSMTRPVGPWVRPRPSAAATDTAGRRNDVERRIGEVERRLEDLDHKLDNRFMWLLAAFAAGFMALGGLILNRTDATNERLGAKIDAVSERLGGRMDTMSQRLSELSERTARIEVRTSPKP